MPRKRIVKMLGDYCPACLRLHAPPACDHLIDAPCPSCGLPLGGLTKDMDGSQCWWCATGRPRPTRSTQPSVKNEPEWWEETCPNR